MSTSSKLLTEEKTRITPRTRLEKVGWVVVVIVAALLIYTVTTNPNFGWTWLPSTLRR